MDRDLSFVLLGLVYKNRHFLIMVFSNEGTAEDLPGLIEESEEEEEGKPVVESFKLGVVSKKGEIQFVR